jgi:hypothetical protein
VAAAGRWEKLAAALCLAQFSEPLFAAIAQSQGLTETPEYARIFFLPVNAFLIWALWRERAQAFATVRAPLMFALLTLAAASTLWSIDGGAALGRVVWLAASMSFAGYLAWRYDWRALLSVLASGYLILVLGSFAATLLAPSISVMTSFHTLSETHVLTANDLFWVIYVAVAAKLGLDGRAAKRSAAP